MNAITHGPRESTESRARVRDEYAVHCALARYNARRCSARVYRDENGVQKRIALRLRLLTRFFFFNSFFYVFFFFIFSFIVRLESGEGKSGLAARRRSLCLALHRIAPAEVGDLRRCANAARNTTCLAGADLMNTCVFDTDSISIDI